MHTCMLTYDTYLCKIRTQKHFYETFQSFYEDKIQLGNYSKLTIPLYPVCLWLYSVGVNSIPVLFYFDRGMECSTVLAILSVPLWKRINEKTKKI